MKSQQQEMCGTILVFTFLTLFQYCLASQSDTKHFEPINWDVKFESGKESAKLYEPSHAMFVKRYLKVRNLAGPGLVAKVTCEDPFTSFSNDELDFGDEWQFYIFDMLSKRHFWCAVQFQSDPSLKYKFRAYGEGAPRANNRIILLRDGARINGRNVTL